MQEIDEVTEQYGGWPEAFQATGDVESSTYEEGSAPLLTVTEDQGAYGKGRRDTPGSA